jgi:hypothetical protein
MRTLAAIIVAAAGLAVVPATAGAAVLFDVPQKTLVCGDAIHIGVWAQAWTTGSRKVSIRVVDVQTERTWWSKRITASKDRWRNWQLPSGYRGQCGDTKITVRGSGWDHTFPVRFRSEGV